MTWHKIEDKQPPMGKLVLVKRYTTGVCLRERGEDCWYDENNNLDESELIIYEWCEIPED